MMSIDLLMESDEMGWYKNKAVKGAKLYIEFYNINVMFQTLTSHKHKLNSYQ